MRGLDGEVSRSGELNAARNLDGAAALQSGNVGIAFEWGERNVAEDFFTTAMRKQMFAESKTVVVARNQPHEHYRLSAIVEESMQSFERSFAIAGEQVISQLEVRQLA